MLLPYLTLLSAVALAQAFTFTVTVGIDETNGKQGIGFDPSTIVPAAGDTIVFTYSLPEYIKNPPPVQHSATQSSFDNPCTPLPGGFDTGAQSTGSANDNTGPSFSLTVNDTQPLWFFSSVGNDCKSGMVLAVNPPTTGDMTAAAFKQKAMSSSGPPPSPAPAPSGSSSGSSSLIATDTSASQSTSAPAQPTTNAGTVVSGKATMGAVLAVLFALVGASVMA